MVQRAPLGEIRSRTCKAQDAWWTVLLVDPLAVRVTWLVQSWRWATPNALTTLAFAVGLGAAVSFGQGGHPWLLLGVLLFHLGFVLDCVDGKIARWNGSGSPLGAWLDYVLDRLRVLVCAVGLFGGQYQATNDLTYVWLGGLVVFLDMFRYLNALMMGRVRAEVTRTGPVDEEGDGGPAPVPAAPAGSPVRRLRDALVRRRIRPLPFSGIEFMMAVFVVGPVVRQIIAVSLLASVLMIAFELLLIHRLYRFTVAHRRAGAVREPG